MVAHLNYVIKAIWIYQGNRGFIHNYWILLPAEENFNTPNNGKEYELTEGGHRNLFKSTSDGSERVCYTSTLL